MPRLDYRGRVYNPGEANCINSKALRRSTCVEGDNITENADYRILTYYSMSQIKKYYSIKEAIADYSRLGELNPTIDESLELRKIIASRESGILPAVGFDATSSVAQH
ncbi:MAG: hypothetical protein AAFN81_33095 [Bacteroidota bacterium]